MSKHRNTHRSGKSSATSAGKPGIPGVAFIVLGVVLIAALSFWWWWSKQSETTPGASPALEAGAKPEFQKLKGKWVRPDGGYVVEIKSVAESGKMEAAYFNPSPIHVSRAEASLDGATVKVFIELRAENYPGSTYTLVYDPKNDQLNGVYYQAMQQQSYEIAFVRME
jgi:hypothetical protein